MAAGAHAADQHVQTLGEVGQNLLGRGLGVDGGVGRILELLRHPGVGRFGEQLAGPFDGAGHAALTRGQLEACAIGEHQPPALQRHGLGHDQDELVALDGRHHGQTDARVAGGGLDDGATRLELAAFFGIFDHRQGDTVLHRAARVGLFGLDPDLLAGTEQPVDAHMRGVADGGKNVVGFHGVRTPCEGTYVPAAAGSCLARGRPSRDNGGHFGASSLPERQMDMQKTHEHNIPDA